jgi:chromosome condensin MukBEF ATPase and DNA-binding subunit MukB
MPLLYWIWNNKRWTLIIVLLIYGFFQTWQSNSLTGDLNKANADCKTKVQQEVDKAVKPYLDAEKKAQELANKAGEQYEESKEVERVKTETITREVQKIVERPVYINTNCFDDDGVSAVNAAGNTSKP